MPGVRLPDAAGPDTHTNANRRTSWTQSVRSSVCDLEKSVEQALKRISSCNYCLFSGVDPFRHSKPNSAPGLEQLEPASGEWRRGLVEVPQSVQLC